MKKQILLITGLFLLSTNISLAQCTISGSTSPVCENSAVQTLTTTGSVIYGPGVTGNSFDPAVAGAGSHAINAYTTNGLGSGFEYTIDQTGAFAPIPSVGTAVTLSDDQVSGVLPIGFNFNFFGTIYTNFYISSNGFISFDPAVSNGCCSGGTFPAADAVNNVIAWSWNDLYPPGGGTISYETIGVAPNRKLLVTFTSQRHCCNTGPNVNTGQIVLNESSNIIEIHNTTITNDGSVCTQGIENASGTIAYSPAGRNAAVWTATNDYVAFIPTMSYAVNPTLPYAPTPSVGTPVTLSDDQVSASLPIGFDFTFFGSTYTNFYISSNGFISFDPAVSNGCCSGGTFPAADAVNNVIAWSWNDLYPPGSGTISYETVGVAPNRKLLVTFTDQYHCCSGPAINTGQIVLNESSNIIEIHNTEITNDGSSCTEGIENASGTIAYTLAGRNSAIWTATNDAVAFIPAIQCATATIVVDPVYTGTDVATICTGGSYAFGTQTITAAGTYTELFATVSGCDSTVTLTMTENPVYTGTDVATICTGGSYAFGTQTITAAGTYTELFASLVTGCDSTVTLTMTENPVLTGTDAATICTGSSYAFGTQTITAAGTYTELFTSMVTGCDSTVTLTMTENPVLTANSAISICTGSSYTFGTQTITAVGTYTELFASLVTGCDSTVTLTVTENPVLTVNSAISICTGDTSIFGTQSITTAGTYTEIFASMVTGCDSTVTLTVIESAAPIISIISATDEMIGNDGAIDISVTGGSTYSYSWDNSDTTQDISGLTSGSYTVIVTDSVNGCTSSAVIALSSQVGVAERLKDLFEIYPNPSNGIFNVVVKEITGPMEILIINSLGQSVMNMKITETTTEIDISSVESGSYFVRVISENGNSVQSIIIE